MQSGPRDAVGRAARWRANTLPRGGDSGVQGAPTLERRRPTGRRAGIGAAYGRGRRAEDAWCPVRRTVCRRWHRRTPLYGPASAAPASWWYFTGDGPRLSVVRGVAVETGAAVRGYCSELASAQAWLSLAIALHLATGWATERVPLAVFAV
jgi:hypothetical protein